MALKDLTEADVEIVRQCLDCVLRSGALEGEFQTRMGLTEGDVRDLLVRWPVVDDGADEPTAGVAINNALNEVTNGVRFSDKEWSLWFTVTRPEVTETYRRWVRSRGWGQTGIT